MGLPGIHPAGFDAVEMKKFVLNVSGYESQPMTMRDVRKLYQEGTISRHTPCRGRRADRWSTVDDMLPMLKYEPRSKLCIAGWTGPMRLTVTNLIVMPAAAEFASLATTAKLS